MIDHKLKVLQMVEAHGGVTAAAEHAGLKPSTVSYQLRQLSEQVGVRLMEPAGRGVKLTAAARTLLQHGAVLEAQWERARSELAAMADVQTGSFTLCGFSTAATHLLPSTAATLRGRHPQLGVRIVEAEPGRCFELLVTGEAAPPSISRPATPDRSLRSSP